MSIISRRKRPTLQDFCSLFNGIKSAIHMQKFFEVGAAQTAAHKLERIVTSTSPTLPLVRRMPKSMLESEPSPQIRRETEEIRKCFPEKQCPIRKIENYLKHIWCPGVLTPTFHPNSRLLANVGQCQITEPDQKLTPYIPTIPKNLHPNAPSIERLFAVAIYIQDNENGGALKFLSEKKVRHLCPPEYLQPHVGDCVIYYNPYRLAEIAPIQRNSITINMFCVFSSNKDPIWIWS